MVPGTIKFLHMLRTGVIQLSDDGWINQLHVASVTISNVNWKILDDVWIHISATSCLCWNIHWLGELRTNSAQCAQTQHGAHKLSRRCAQTQQAVRTNSARWAQTQQAVRTNSAGGAHKLSRRCAQTQHGEHKLSRRCAQTQQVVRTNSARWAQTQQAVRTNSARCAQTQQAVRTNSPGGEHPPRGSASPAQGIHSHKWEQYDFA